MFLKCCIETLFIWMAKPLALTLPGPSSMGSNLYLFKFLIFCSPWTVVCAVFFTYCMKIVFILIAEFPGTPSGSASRASASLPTPGRGGHVSSGLWRPEQPWGIALQRGRSPGPHPAAPPTNTPAAWAAPLASVLSLGEGGFLASLLSLVPGDGQGTAQLS